MKLFDFAYCGNYNKAIAELALLSPEQWSYSSINDNIILKKYIEHTFSRLYDERKILEDENYAVFNTGLFTSNYSRIYAYFTENIVANRQKWYLQGFVTEYQLASLGITALPKRANYFTNISDLIFDTSLEIVPQYDHIFGDEENLNRLPSNIKNSAVRIQLFDGAVKNAKLRLECNYKTAVPQYYNNEIQLLIPICFSDPSKPDLALACSKTADGTKYLGCTCLTLEMAYNNARLIAKPDSEWLIP